MGHEMDIGHMLKPHYTAHQLSFTLDLKFQNPFHAPLGNLPAANLIPLAMLCHTVKQILFLVNGFSGDHQQTGSPESGEQIQSGHQNRYGKAYKKRKFKQSGTGDDAQAAASEQIGKVGGALDGVAKTHNGKSTCH